MDLCLFSRPVRTCAHFFCFFWVCKQWTSKPGESWDALYIERGRVFKAIVQRLTYSAVKASTR
eukprot:6400104-Amphidinium_carterae.1